MKLALLAILFAHANSDSFLVHRDVPESSDVGGKDQTAGVPSDDINVSPKSDDIRKPTVLSATKDEEDAEKHADDTSSSKTVISVPLDSELQAAEGKVTPRAEVDTGL
eukprot:CAMPEP_0172660486 /NCGR_PEP_ID=MMETSP1074-20121228/4091_1 /TAXON_ID=2916 /ORGANISM="Ceratium fusus, Strain PA161109" /LENGTH=107 /DNA_ID=CAMNT_0013476105 /DNA_START=74 /DNA_END=400 /DNA_ORIENTATION=+